MADIQHAPLPSGARDPRLDFFRGLSLVMIYVNHVPGTIYEHFTSRNYGLSDAAEGFVFMSGCAAALAYGPKLKTGLNWPGVRKIWGRSWLLYMVHILTAVWAIAIASAAALWFGGAEMLQHNAFERLNDQPLGFLVGIATLGHQLGYVNILPMYAVLLLCAPLTIRLGQRKPMVLLAISVALWVVTGFTGLNLPNFPFDTGWFFNPFAWQLLFNLGLLTGLGLRHGHRFVPIRAWLVWPAAAWVLFSLFWAQSEQMQADLGHVIWLMLQYDVPRFLVEFDKSVLSGPRLLHFLALAYLLSLPGIVPRFAASKLMTPVRILGRHGLPVFAAGTVLSVFAQAVKTAHPGGFWQDSVLILGGLAIQWALAAIRERIKQPPPHATHGGSMPEPRTAAPRDEARRFAAAAH